MRKIVILAFMAFFVPELKAQNPEYFTIVTAGINTGKNSSGASEKEFHGKIQGVYGGEGKIGFAYHALKVMPIGKKHGMPLEAYTVVSLGVGKINNTTEDSKIAFGAGPTVAIVPNHGSNPKTSSIYYGGTAHVNYVNTVHLGGDVTFVAQPPKNEYDYSKNMFLGEFEGTYFFNKIVGVKAIYWIEISSQEERLVPNVPFNQNRNSNSKGSLAGGLCLRFGSAMIFAGPTIRTTGQKYTYIDQWGALIDGKYHETPPMRMNLAVNFNLERDGD